MRTYQIIVVEDETQEALDSFEIEVEDFDDLERLTHPLAAKEYAEQIQSIIRNSWEAEDDD